MENPAHCVTPICPTYLSSDLLSPGQIRKTTPNIGYQPVERPPLGGHTWGENVTNYGGIGKLSFLGKARARDLYVSRSHRHFSSGFSIYDTAVQPQKVTSLLKSACRINDQLIPPPFYVALDPVKYTYPQKWPVNPYFSHTSKFEVLPKHDQNRTTPAGGHHVLSEGTRNALADYYYTVYDQPRYNMCYPDNTAVIQSRVAAGQLRAEIPEKTAPEENPGEKKATEEASTEGGEEELWVMSLIEGVISEMGPVRQHCCFRDILLKIFEYEGPGAVRRCLDTLFINSDSLMTCDAFRRYFGDNAAHIYHEIVQLKHALGDDIRRIVDIIEVAWTYGNAIRNMTDFQAFQCLLDENNSGCKGKQSLQELPRLNQEELDKDAALPCDEREEYLQKLRDSLDKLAHKPQQDQGQKDSPADLKAPRCQQEGQVAGRHPLWPPGAYITNKPWMSLQSTKAYPTQFTDECKRRKTNVDSALSGFVEPLKESKRVTFADECLPAPSISYPSRTADVELKNKMTADAHGLPRYTKYLNEIIPSPLMKKAAPLEQTERDLQQALPTLQPEPAFPSLPHSDALQQSQDSGSGRKQLAPLMSPPQPPPLSQCLEPTGNRIQDHLGLSYKTLAHKRFHQLYPDKIPDLRDNCRFRKRNFFQGYHGSAFRGNTQAEVINAHS